jgi:two-component sensor histidine kinase/methyl-accepting chemotaxis protein
LNNNKKNTSKIFSKKSFLYFTGFPKITIVFTLLIFVVIVNAIINIYFIYKDRNNIEKITEFINPYLNDLNRLNKTIVESKMYTTNWVHVPNSVEDKAKLDSLQKFIYPEIKSNLIAKTKVLKENFPDYKAIENIEFIFKDLDKLIQAQKKVMITLACFDDYENPNKKFKAEDIIESFLFPKTQLILTRLTIITREVEKSTNDLTQSILNDSKRITNILIFLSLLLIIFIVLSIEIIITNIRKPSIEMKKVMDTLSKGELLNTHIQESDNIIGEMALSLNILTNNFKKTVLFAQEIENGNLSVSFEKLSENDHLGEALINMRNSLKSYSSDMETKIKLRTDEVIQKSKEIEIQKIFYESILSTLPMDISIYNEDKKYVYVNEVAITDKETRNFLIGKTDVDYCNHKKIDIEFAKKREHFFDYALQNNTTSEFVDEILDEKQNTSWKIRRFTPVYEGDVFRYMIAYGMDMTNMKNQEIQIKESLEEKESLLGEIHHRVKNNLTLVLGLIEMQRDMQSDELLKNQFNEIKNRIYAMSLIHDKMYKSNSFANIELDDYLKDLVTTVSRFYGKGKEINLKFELQKILVKGKDAIPIALLMNEVVTNSFKYAFNSNDNKEGNVLFVSLHKEKDSNEIKLIVKDNGHGLSDKFDLKKSKSLGFKLINIFVKQLKGELKYYNDNGLTFEMKFNL